MAEKPLDQELYTGGGMDTDRRGESMVQKHAEKIQQEKEEKAMEKVGALMPQIGRVVHALALSECQWDVERALILLRQFHADNAEKLAALHKKRKKLKKHAAEAAVAHQEDRKDSGAEASASGSEDSGGSSGEDSDASRERSRKHKKKSGKSSKSSKKSKGSKDKRSKKRRREREDSPRGKDSKPKLTHGDSFGKYGILRETDYYSKRSEFIRWSMDEKKIDVDQLPKNEERDLFREYMEDFNTGTLPHKKYYDLEAYDRYKAAKAARRGRADAEAEAAARKRSGAVDFNDEQELMRERQEARAREQQERLKQAFQELQSSDKARDMREQELLRMQANLAYKTGDTATALKLMERLKPDDQKEEAARK